MPYLPLSLALLSTMAFISMPPSEAATTAPTTMSVSAGDIDGVVKSLAKANDGASVMLYSSTSAKLTSLFKFSTKGLGSTLTLEATLTQTTAKNIFTFQVLNSSGNYVSVASTSGTSKNKTIKIKLPAGSVVNNTVKIRLTSASADDLKLDYLVLNDQGSVVTPPVVTPPVTPPVIPPVTPPVVTPPVPAITAVPAGISFHLQLQGQVNLDTPAKLYDIDLYDTTEATIATLKDQGKIVICYFSAGSYEDWRIDAALFPKVALGNNLDGWPGEKWVDVRNEGVRKIMADRMTLAKKKGCDGVDPDNVDGYTNKPGFPLTMAHQIDYNKFLATTAHSKGLLIGLKNATDQVTALVDYYDFSIVESCNVYNECARYSPFIAQNKAVLLAEYTKFSAAICASTRSLNFTTVFFNQALDGKLMTPCP